jgi:hypothetical protein
MDRDNGESENFDSPVCTVVPLHSLLLPVFSSQKCIFLVTSAITMDRTSLSTSVVPCEYHTHIMLIHSSTTYATRS